MLVRVGGLVLVGVEDEGQVEWGGVAGAEIEDLGEGLEAWGGDEQIVQGGGENGFDMTGCRDGN